VHDTGRLGHFTTAFTDQIHIVLTGGFITDCFVVQIAQLVSCVCVCVCLSVCPGDYFGTKSPLTYTFDTLIYSENLTHRTCFWRPRWDDIPPYFAEVFGTMHKTRGLSLGYCAALFSGTFNRFGRTPTCERRQRDGHTSTVYTAYSRSKEEKCC